MKIGVFLLMVITIFVGLLVYIDRKASKIEENFPVEFSSKAPVEYLDLIKNSNVQCLKTFKIKARNEISNFSCDGKYYLQIYKLDSSFNGSLRMTIKESYLNNNGYHNLPYELNEQNCAEFRYKLYEPGKPDKIYFSLYGNRTQIVKKNDSVALYHSNFKNLSVRFLQNSDDDIYAKANQDNNFIGYTPFEILFLKRHSKLYLIFFSVNNGNTTLKPGMVFDFIK